MCCSLHILRVLKPLEFRKHPFLQFSWSKYLYQGALQALLIFLLARITGNSQAASPHLIWKWQVPGVQLPVDAFVLAVDLGSQSKSQKVSLKLPHQSCQSSVSQSFENLWQVLQSCTSGARMACAFVHLLACHQLYFRLRVRHTRYVRTYSLFFLGRSWSASLLGFCVSTTFFLLLIMILYTVNVRKSSNAEDSSL